MYLAASAVSCASTSITLEDAEVPDILRPIQAVRFFEYDRVNQEHRPFFWRGLVRDDRFFDAVRLLAVAVERTIKGVARSPVPAELRVPPPTAFMAAPQNGRTVFVAKAAHDLGDAYRGLVAELEGRGYRVVPPPNTELSDEKDQAEREIVQALSDAELAIHLVGRRPGNIPHGADQGIVPLQLTLSADCATRGDFERVIWAPKVLDLFEEGALESARAGVDERDPLERLTAMRARLLPDDRVDGGPFAAFRQLLIRKLERGNSRPEQVEQPLVPFATRFYLLHHEKDRRFAIDVAKEIKSRGFVAWLPSIDGGPQEQRMLHKQRLADCDAVLLCWRDGSGTWVEITAGQLRDFRELERAQPFRCRIVLIGGEPTAAKREYCEIYSSEEIDRVIDGTKGDLAAAVTELLKLLPARSS